MGNPAGDKFKKRLKRQKFETRMEGLAYVPREVREELKKAMAAVEAKNKAKVM